MLNIIDSKFHYRIKFVGQIDNSQINHFLNKAKLAVFPSIFDNFPYAVLEAMSAGKHIICSDNMGVLDLIKNNKYNFIFKHYSYKDLAQKMCDFYDLKTPFLNNMNIEKVNNLCNQKHICEKMKSYYKIAINEYKKTDEQINLYSKILKKGGINDKILKIKNIKSNLANDVKKVITQNNCYIIKKYNYDYDFSLSNDLYTIYSKKNFNVVRPINSELIIFDGYNYNIFNYIPHTNKTVSNDFLIEMIKCDRKVNMRANLNDKCDKYYNYLLKLKSYKLEEEEFVIKMYKNLRSYTLFNDTYLNHGDLSKSNILHYNNNYYLIDFDEVTISTELYDFANIVVKHKVKNNKFQLEEIKYIISLLSNKYTFNDYIVSIKYYLCKILLEKFYLFEREVINLMDDVQIKDDYRKYILLLKEIDKMENF